MKNWTVGQWVLFGLAIALLIACVVCYFVAPSFTFLTSGLLIGGLAGFIGGYFYGKKAGVTSK